MLRGRTHGSLSSRPRTAARMGLERIMRHVTHANTLLAALVSSDTRAPVVRYYAGVLTAFRRAPAETIRVPADPPDTRPAHAAWPRPCGWVADLKAALRGRPLEMLIADWPEAGPDALPRLFASARALDTPAVIIRQARLDGVRRVVLATAGGPHTLHLFWVARAVAAAHGVPVHAVRIAASDPAAPPDEREAPTDPTAIGTRLFGVPPAVAVSAGTDPVSGIRRLLRPGDLLVLGAPNPLRHAAFFPGSIPDRLARALDTPLLLLLSRPRAPANLRHVFWGQLIQTGMRPRDRRALLARLLDVLAQHNQIPGDRRDDLLDRALDRERALPTAVNHATAFPHIVVPGLLGILGAMAICPDGVDFGSADGTLTRYVFLLITPEGFHDEYLETLARIARRMTRADIRAALLACRSPAAVLDVLEPRPTEAGWPAAAMPDAAAEPGCPPP